MIKQNCLFCNIASGQMEAATIFENSEFKVFLDRFPATIGHTLIIPKEHIEDIYDIDVETAAKLFALATHVAKSLKKILNCDGMNIVQNNGEIAGQTLSHFHLHIIPRYENDNITIKWENLQLTEEELNDVAEQVAKEI